MLDICGWVVVVVNGWVVCVVSCLWVVGVRVGVVFIHLRAVVVIRGCLCVCGHIRSWAVVVMWVMFILVGSHRPWVLIVKRGVVVGDGGVFVVVFPHRPRMWVFVLQKVAIDVACMVYVHATSRFVVAPFVGTTTSWS